MPSHSNSVRASRTKKPSNLTNLKHLPRILCLHGKGSSATIFRLQTRALQKSLQHHFRLIFIDAPFKSDPGPGILPIFADAGPYYEWVKSDDSSDDPSSRAREIIQLALNNPDGASFVGLLGFSEGASVIASFLLQLQDQVLSSPSSSSIPKSTIQFAALLAATMPITELQQEKEYRAINTASLVRKISLPTVHVHGLADPIQRECERLVEELFDSTVTEVVHWNGGHAVMIDQKDVARLTDVILRLSAGDLK